MSERKQIAIIRDSDQLRAKLHNRIKVYENDWEDILDEEIKKQFVQETAANILLMLDTSQNVFRRIIRETTTVYNEPTERSMVSGENVVDVPRWDAILKELRLDLIMGEAHNLAKAGTTAFLRVYTIPDAQRMGIEIIPSDVVQVDLSPDDKTRPVGIGYKVIGTPKDKDRIWWVYYTADARYFLDANGFHIGDPRADDNHDPTPEETVNRYGVIPIVPFHANAVVRMFWRQNWNRDAYKANILIGVLNTYLNFLVKTQSFKQIAFTGAKPTKELLNAISDPLYPLVVTGENASAQVLDLNTRLEAIDSVILGKIAAIANNYGISKDNFTISGEVASGFSLRVASRALEEIRTSDKAVCYATELGLFDVIRTINNIDFPGTPIGDEYELRWNPGEIEYPPTWEEEEKEWEFKFRHGIDDEVGFVMAHDPDIGEDEAVKQLEHIQERSATLNPPRSIQDEILFPQEATGATG